MNDEGRGFAGQVLLRTRALLEEDGRPSGPLIVAFSGGLDSCVLLHALCFGGGLGRGVVAAHFDHGMRLNSANDADWAAGVCRAWEVPFRRHRADRVLRSEDEARSARYDFLEGLVAELPGATVLTAHHADDQAETVLFRAVRGTGLAGLRGIPARREPALVRPLLDFWRDDLERYAAHVGLRWREDPTNERLGHARNLLRHSILPELERGVAPGARRALTRLARLAGGNEDAWAEVMPRVLEDLDADDDSVDADAIGSAGPALRARVLRHLARGEGATLDEQTTERAAAFAAASRSGSGLELGGGLVLRRELDRLRFARLDSPATGSVEASSTLRIDGPGPGEGVLQLDGRLTRVRWMPGGSESRGKPEAAGAAPYRAHFLVDGLRFPLTVRSRRSGDRIVRTGGTAKVKKVLLESRVPSMERAAVAVVADAADAVVWLAGIAQAASVAAQSPGEGTLTLEVEQ